MYIIETRLDVNSYKCISKQNDQDIPLAVAFLDQEKRRRQRNTLDPQELEDLAASNDQMLLKALRNEKNERVQKIANSCQLLRLRTNLTSRSTFQVLLPAYVLHFIFLLYYV